MFEKFFPKEWVDSTYNIDYQKYYDQGYRGVIFDIDNTLVPHGVDADERAVKLFEKLREIGFDVCLLSNNKKHRVERFNRAVNANYIFKAQKPYSRNYYQAATMMKISIKSVLCIGDQLFTDIYGGNLAGIYTILVNPINKKEEIQIRLKRFLEKPVLMAYKKKLKKSHKSYPRKKRI
ncbi:MAG: YqeG family HAD IIIA-type phosphatase [Lachnospiraceae bacterium]|nr:YqeG family HAD IIIA-type phosphatase [Lachnospiraceae bacterium]